MTVQQLVLVVLCYIFSTINGQRELQQFDEKGPDFSNYYEGEFQESVGIPKEPSIQGVTICEYLLNEDLPKFSLSQSDFNSGTKIIDRAGIYTLSSDIYFNPNSAAALGVDYYSAGDVQPEQYAFYDPKAYGIGFFAAIAVTTDNVLIDLNGYSIIQSEEHALQQRFYTHIELASSPFIEGQGPHDFGPIKSANKVCIKNGSLGRSSHGAIHGNGNSYIEIRDLKISDYETAAIQFNKGIDIVIENIEIPNAREDVPVACRFSAARFIRPWINKLVTSGYTGKLTVQGQVLTAQDIQKSLRDAVNDAAQQVLSTGKISGELEPLFGNPSGLPDGSAMYGIALNFLGVAVNGIPSNVPIGARSQRITIRDVQIGVMKLDVQEMPALTTDGTTAAIDVVGAVLDTKNEITLTNYFQYKGNPVANAQLLVAKAIHEGFNFEFLSTGKNKISPEIITWAESGKPYYMSNISYICNGDMMFHVMKGPIAFKLDSTTDLLCENCVINYIENFGDLGSLLCKNNDLYMKGEGVSNPFATQFGYNGASAHGFSLSSTTNAELRNSGVNTIVSKAGNAIGLEMMFGSSVIKLVNFFVGSVQAGTAYSREAYIYNPTPMPIGKDIYEDVSVRGVEIIE